MLTSIAVVGSKGQIQVVVECVMCVPGRVARAPWLYMPPVSTAQSASTIPQSCRPLLTNCRPGQLNSIIDPICPLQAKLLQALWLYMPPYVNSTASIHFIHQCQYSCPSIGSFQLLMQWFLCSAGQVATGALAVYATLRQQHSQHPHHCNQHNSFPQAKEAAIQRRHS